MIDVTIFWNALPSEAQSFIISVAANLATGFVFKGRKKDDYQKALQKAYEEGLKHFAVEFGETCEYNLKKVFEKKEVMDFFRDVVRGPSLKNQLSPLKTAIHAAGVDMHTIPGFDLRHAINAFLEAFNQEAESSSDLLRLLSLYKADESVKVQKEGVKTQKKILEKISGPIHNLGKLKEKYLKYLVKEYTSLDFKGMTREPISIPIKDLFIRLCLEDSFPGNEIEFRLVVERTKGISEKKIFRKKPEATFADLLRVPFAVIIGDPGAGKSTILKYMALAFAEKENSDRLNIGENYLPIIFPISYFAQKYRESGTESYPIKTSISRYFCDKDLPNLDPLFDHYASKRKALYLFDGLDEVRDEAERKMVMEAVHSFIINQDEGNRYLITCRTASYSKTTQFKPIGEIEFPVFRILPFDLEQIRAFLINWSRWYQKKIRKIKEVNASITNEAINPILNPLKENERFQKLASNPLMLTILSLIAYNEGGELPRARVQLYERCLNMMAGLWEKLRGLKAGDKRDLSFGGGDIGEDFLVKHLGPLALMMQERGFKAVDESEFKKSLIKSLDARNKDKDLSRRQVGELIQILHEQSGIIQETSPGAYGFLHPTFREYLAARFLAVKPSPSKILGDRLFTAEWREVVLLTAASLMPPAASNFLRAVLKAKVDNHQALFLTAECAFDMNRERIDDSLFRKILAELESLAFGSASPLHRARAGELLGWLGDKRNLREFINIPGGEYPMMGKKQTITPFAIGKYPVTNGWFEEFIRSKGYEKREFWSPEGKDWLRYTKAEKPLFWDDRHWRCPNAPVVGVCWYEADAFCRWLTLEERKDGFTYRLPREEEWEAAVAGKEGREYPWGNEWQEEACNTEEAKIGKTTAVGIFPKGDTPEGIADMAGNVWEWTRSDYHHKNMQQDFPFDEEIQRLRDEGKIDEYVKAWEDKNRLLPVLRGGSWGFYRDSARCADRDRDRPEIRDSYVGFRCARTS